MSRFLLICLGALSGLAVAGPASAITLGGSLGFGSSNLVGDAASGGKYRAGASPAIALLLDFEVGTGVALSVQPGYSRTSAQIVFQGSDSLTTDIRIDYVEVPVMLRVYVNEKPSRPYVLGGFGVGFPVSAKREGPLGETDILDDLETVDLRAKFAFGMRFPVWSNGMLVELRYSQAITNITTNTARAEGERFKSTSFGLWVGYAFDL